jgi:hypothetical protein
VDFENLPVGHVQLLCRVSTSNHFFAAFSAFTLAQRALVAAIILAIPSGLILPFFFGLGLTTAFGAVLAFIAAHLAFCAALIRV